MDYKAIVNLMKEMNNTDLTKLEIEEEGIRICLEKTATVVTMTQPVMPSVTMAPAMPATQMVQPQAQANSGAANEVVEDLSGKKVVSPMVGTFYSSPSPDKPAFVKVGDKVKKGQTVCIIEAMKLMNEIECEHDGEIVKILVNNEEMVEFGQPLFLIK